MSRMVHHPLSRCCIAWLAMLAVSHAQAQSNVTLYGQVDAGLAYVNPVDGGPVWVQASGLVESSYWGIKGSETLGNGFNAVFRLERGFSMANGAQVDDRPYFLGLESPRLGTVTLGKQFDLIHDYYTPFTLAETTGGSAFAPPFDNDNESGTWLAANSVKYASPMLGPLRFSAMYGFKDNAAPVPSRSYGLGLAVLTGDFSTALSWLHFSGIAPPGLRSGSGALRLPGISAPLASVTVDHYDTIGLGMNYKLGNVSLNLAASRSIFGGIAIEDSDTPPLSIAFNNYEVNATWQVTSAVSLAGMYNYTIATGFGHWHEFAIQPQYLLSERTSLYAESVYIRASSNAGATAAQAEGNGDRNQWLFAIGMRHSF